MKIGDFFAGKSKQDIDTDGERMNHWCFLVVRLIDTRFTQEEIVKKNRNALAETAHKKRDNSLRGNAMRRARSGDVPRTLTPWEWHEWYSEHGMPQEFGRVASDAEPNTWQRFIRKLMGRS